MAIPRLSIDDGDTSGAFVWRPPQLVVLPSGFVQGGATLGAAMAAMEAVTDKPVRWASCQFLAAPSAGASVDLRVFVGASGRSSAQAACDVVVDGTLLSRATAALGSRDASVDRTPAELGAIPPPGDCDPHLYFATGNGDLGDLAELRVAVWPSEREPGRFAMWARGRADSSDVLTPWDLAIIGDLAPMGLRHVIGAPYIGSSVDNAIRVGRVQASEWVLIDLRVDQIVDGFAHCRAGLWAQDGTTLLATVAQTATLRRAERA